MDKASLHLQVIAQLETLHVTAQQAAQTAYEAATDKANIAENKYDTLGLEASYLATGQARRAEELRQALSLWQRLQLRPYDPQQGIQLGALVYLSDARGQRQWLFIGPEGAGLKLQFDGQQIHLISPRSPLGQRLIGGIEGDWVELPGSVVQRFEILRIL